MSVDVKRIETPANGVCGAKVWMEGVDGRWKVVTRAADQVTGYGRTRGVKRTQGSKLLGAACFPEGFYL